MQPRTRFLLGGTVIVWAAGLQVRVVRATARAWALPQSAARDAATVGPPASSSSPHPHGPTRPSLSLSLPFLPFQAHMWWLQRQPDFERAFPKEEE